MLSNLLHQKRYSVELASVAGGATAMEPKALEPWVGGEEGCGLEVSLQGSMLVGERLICVITSQLFNLVSDHTFPSAPTSYIPSFTSSLIKGASGAEHNATKEVLNCLCVLQRVLPVVFELESEPSVFEREVLWKQDIVVAEEEEREESIGLAWVYGVAGYLIVTRTHTHPNPYP